MADAFTGDRIILKDLGFYGYHGVFAEEEKLGQRFFIDLELGADLTAPATTDITHHAIAVEETRVAGEARSTTTASPDVRLHKYVTTQSAQASVPGVSSRSWIRSNEVNRAPQPSHWRRRRIAVLSSVGRLSFT